MVAIIKKASRIKKKYFLEEEFKETIDPNAIYNPMAKAVKKEYTFKCSGARYIGDWVGGFRHGQGTMQWKDGARYEGQWSLGRATGNGVFTHAKGEIYDGQWRYDKAHGYGTYIHTNGAKYEGEWF